MTEGRYDKLNPTMETVHRVGLIKIVPETITGKYKFGKSWDDAKKLRVATKLLERAMETPRLTVRLLNIAGLEELNDESAKNVSWTHAKGLAKMLGYENMSEYPEISLQKIHDVDW